MRFVVLVSGRLPCGRYALLQRGSPKAKLSPDSGEWAPVGVCSGSDNFGAAGCALGWTGGTPAGDSDFNRLGTLEISGGAAGSVGPD